MLLICRYVVEESETHRFGQRARRALELLGRADGCRGGRLGRSPDDPTRWVLTVEFDSVSAYRRALSPFDVREHVVPFLSEAQAEEPATYEVLLESDGAEVQERSGIWSPSGGSGQRA